MLVLTHLFRMHKARLIHLIYLAVSVGLFSSCQMVSFLAQPETRWGLRQGLEAKKLYNEGQYLACYHTMAKVVPVGDSLLFETPGYRNDITALGVASYHIGLAVVNEQLGRYQQGIDTLNAFLKMGFGELLGPRHKVLLFAQFIRASNYLQIGEYAAARRDLELLYDSLQYYHERDWEGFEEGKFDVMISLLFPAVEKKPTWLLGLAGSHLGGIYWHSGRPDSSVQVMEDVIRAMGQRYEHLTPLGPAWQFTPPVDLPPPPDLATGFCFIGPALASKDIEATSAFMAAQLHNNLGFIALHTKGDTAQARLHLDQVGRYLEAYRQEKVPQAWHRLEGRNAYNQGLLSLETGQPRQAKRFFGQAIRAWRRVYAAPHPDLAAGYRGWGDALLDEGKLDSAIWYHQRALLALSEAPSQSWGQGPPRAATMLHVPEGPALCLRLGQLQESLALGRAKGLGPALQSYQLGIDLLNAVSETHLSEEIRLKLRTNYAYLFEAAINATWTQYRAEPRPDLLEGAYQLMSRSKGALLRLQLRENAPNRLLASNAALRQQLAQRRSLRTQVFGLKRGLYSLEKPATTNQEEQKKYEQQRRALMQQQRQAQEALDQLDLQMRQAHPRYFEFVRAEDSISMQATLEQLPDSCLMVEYFWGRHYLYVWYALNGQSHWDRVELAPWEGEVDRFRALLATNPMDNAEEDYREKLVLTGHGLYQILLEPFLVRVGPQRVRQIVVVPDGKLHYLPFDLLLTRPCSVEEFQPPYLFLRHELRYQYLSQVAPRPAHMPGQSQKRWLYLGIAPGYTGRPRDTLHWNQDEIARAAQILGGGHTYYGLPGTERGFFLDTAGRYRILHLAMHATVNDVTPALSGLRFDAWPPGADSSVLHAYEIYPLRLQADFTVLSGCETGMGKLYRGEGVMSLARAFQVAGCSSIMMTLWEVPDTRDHNYIISYIFEALREGHTKARAVQLAKQRFIEDPPLPELPWWPHFWAPYVLVGDDAPLFGL